MQLCVPELKPTRVPRDETICLQPGPRPGAACSCQGTSAAQKKGVEVEANNHVFSGCLLDDYCLAISYPKRGVFDRASSETGVSVRSSDERRPECTVQ